MDFREESYWETLLEDNCATFYQHNPILVPIEQKYHTLNKSLSKFLTTFFTTSNCYWQYYQFSFACHGNANASEVFRFADVFRYLCCSLFTYSLTYSMEQGPSWEASWFAAGREIPRVLWNPKVPHRTHKRPPPVPILSQPNPVLIP